MRNEPERRGAIQPALSAGAGAEPCRAEPPVETGAEYKLTPLTGVGTAQPHDPELAHLSEIVAQMNDLFAGELSDADLLSYARHISGKMLENPTLAQQADTNSREQFAMGDFARVFLDTIIEGLENYQSMAEQVLTTEKTRRGFERLILEMVYAGFAGQRPPTVGAEEDSTSIPR